MNTEADSVTVREFRVRLENTVFRLYMETQRPDVFAQPGTENELHNHTNSELFVCLRGQVVLNTEHGLLTLFDGDTALVPAGVYHKKHHVVPGTVERTFGFTCSKISAADSENLYKTLCPFITGSRILVYRDRPELIGCTQKLIGEIEAGGTFTAALRMIELLLCASKLRAETNEEELPTPRKQTSFVNDTQRMLELEQIVELDYMRNLRVGDVSKKLNIGARQLARIVRRRYGKTLHEVLMDKRIKAAEWRLLTTKDPANRIAESAGFTSAAGFYREFRKRNGCTPAEFRKRGKVAGRVEES